MTPHDQTQMRNALLDVIERSGENFKRQFGFSAEADWIIRDLKATLLDEQALAAQAAPTERAPLVRLTRDEVDELEALHIRLHRGLTDAWVEGVEDFAHAVMDAMEAKNK